MSIFLISINLPVKISLTDKGFFLFFPRLRCDPLSPRVRLTLSFGTHVYLWILRIFSYKNRFQKNVVVLEKKSHHCHWAYLLHPLNKGLYLHDSINSLSSPSMFDILVIFPMQSHRHRQRKSSAHEYASTSDAGLIVNLYWMSQDGLEAPPAMSSTNSIT